MGDPGAYCASLSRLQYSIAYDMRLFYHRRCRAGNRAKGGELSTDLGNGLNELNCFPNPPTASLAGSATKLPADAR